MLFSAFTTLATASGSSLTSAFLQVFTHSHTTLGGRHRAFQQRWVVENLKRDPRASDTHTNTHKHTHTHTLYLDTQANKNISPTAHTP